MVNRHDAGPSDDLGGLILLDVPDYDSVKDTNRLEMERVAELADLLLWVTDPEKYGDAAMHGYLARLSGHGAVMAMVLNKADTLPPEQMGHCRADLMLLLQDVGLYETEVLTAAAATEPPQVERVRALLVRAVAERRAMTDRLRADIGHAADELLAEVGAAPADHEVTDRTARTLARDLVDAAGLDPVCAAVEAGHRRDARAATGWPFTRWARLLRPHPLRRLRLQEGTQGRSSLPEPSGVQRTRTDGAIRDAVAEAATGLDGAWTDVLRRAATPDPSELADRLETAVSGAVRTTGQRRPRWWGLVNAVQLALAAAVVVGALWLGVLAFGAYLQLPALPTPTYRRIPVPTGLLVGGAVLGVLLAVLARRLAGIGARRRSRAVRRAATTAVEEVSEELIITPMRTELTNRGDLHRLLTEAKAAAAGPTGRRRRRARR
ncbi:MAG: ABC transporter [Actinomycetota bacterium]